MRGEFIDVGDQRLYYYAAGSRGAGETVVLIHGFPTSGHLWRDVVPALPAGHRVVVVDLLGYGRSDPPGSSALDIRSHADRVLAVMDQLRIDCACVVGHGLGGGVAQSLAVRAARRVSRLCLVDSIAFDGWVPRMMRFARATLPVARLLPGPWLLSLVRGELLRGYADNELGQHDVDRYLRAFESDDGRDALFAHVAALDSRDTHALAPFLGDISVPASIVWGEYDVFLQPSVGQRLQSTVSGSTFDVVPSAGHFVPREAPHAVAAAITSLLSR